MAVSHQRGSVRRSISAVSKRVALVGVGAVHLGLSLLLIGLAVYGAIHGLEFALLLVFPAGSPVVGILGMSGAVGLAALGLSAYRVSLDYGLYVMFSLSP